MAYPVTVIGKSVKSSGRLKIFVNKKVIFLKFTNKNDFFY